MFFKTVIKSKIPRTMHINATIVTILVFLEIFLFNAINSPTKKAIIVNITEMIERRPGPLGVGTPV